MNRILVIKHGALGDVVLATGPFAAIRRQHADAHITLLTTAPYAKLLATSPYFDEMWVDSRPKIYHFGAFFGLMKRIRNGGFSRIYDLQTSERTSWYCSMLGHKRPEWVGVAKGCSHPHNTADRTKLHTIERHKQQLEVAGIHDVPGPDLSWLKADITRFRLPERYALLAPGGSSHRPGKRWPASHYGEVCNWMLERGVTPVLLGTDAEGSVLSTIESICPGVINLKGQTNFAEVAEMARGAAFAIGNDTGPTHLIVAAGTPALVLFSQFSNPDLCAPRGRDVTILREEKLADLQPARVTEWIGKRLKA